MQHTDYTHLMRVRELLAHCDVPLETLNADLARERIRAANKQLDDYILPRAGSLDAPLTVVVGGSTGAGKSTLVNSLLGEPLTRAGAIPPHHPPACSAASLRRCTLPGIRALPAEHEAS